MNKKLRRTRSTKTQTRKRSKSDSLFRAVSPLISYTYHIYCAELMLTRPLLWLAWEACLRMRCPPSEHPSWRRSKSKIRDSLSRRDNVTTDGNKINRDKTRMRSPIPIKLLEQPSRCTACWYWFVEYKDKEMCVRCLVSYRPCTHYITAILKQLYF